MSEIIKFTPAHIQELTDRVYKLGLKYRRSSNETQKIHVLFVQAKEKLRVATQQLGVS